MTTKREVAEWMYQELMRDGYLSQARTHYLIIKRFGHRFVQGDEIDTSVLDEWQRLTSDKVIWNTPSQVWLLKHRKEN